MPDRKIQIFRYLPVAEFVRILVFPYPPLPVTLITRLHVLSAIMTAPGKVSPQCHFMKVELVPTFRFGTLYVLVIIDHGRRKVIHFKATENPTMQWVIQQLREATPFGLQPKYMFRDNDRIYGHGVRRFLDSCDIDEVRTSYRSPWQDPIFGRFFQTLRREMLDHVIVFGPKHAERLIKEFLEEYYHSHRPHQGLNMQPPIPIERPEFSVAGCFLRGLRHQLLQDML